VPVVAVTATLVVVVCAVSSTPPPGPTFVTTLGTLCAPASSRLAGTAPSVNTGASSTAAIVIGIASVSDSAPVVPVLPRSFVVIVRLPSPLTFAAGV